MKAVRLHAINELKLDEVSKPEVARDQILVKVGACGICGSDIPRVFLLGSKVYPVTLGHEISGKVVEVANSKDNDLIGKNVSVFNIIPCHKCEKCRIGDYAHCSNISYIGTRLDGGFAEYCLVPSRFNLVVCPSDKVSFIELAMLEPISVALHTVRAASIKPWNSMVVLGAGPIGLLVARWAKIFGLKKIILVDNIQEKIEFAKTHGFPAVHVSGINKLFSLSLDDSSADIVIEGTGDSNGLALAIEIVKHRGKIVLLGNPKKDITIQTELYSQLLRKELKLKSVWNSFYHDNPINEWKYGMACIANGSLMVKDLVTHSVSLNEVVCLFNKIYKGEIIACKAMYSAMI